MRIRNNLSGLKFNRLTVLSPVPREVGERTHYDCVCECGNEVVVEGTKIRSNHTKSCGCIRKDVDYGKGVRLPEGEASRNALINNYKYNAKSKGINFELTDDEMIEMFESDCYYCGREPYMATHRKGLNGSYIYTGIDRLDNDISVGYTIENTKPCCTQCNYIKNKLNHDEFVKWVVEVYTNLTKNGMENPREPST